MYGGEHSDPDVVQNFDHKDGLGSDLPNEMRYAIISAYINSVQDTIFSIMLKYIYCYSQDKCPICRLT
jgi:hypothetical protein